MPLWDAGGKYKKFYVDSVSTHVCVCVSLCAHCMWIFLRSIIRGGLAGRGGCVPCGHKIKEHKSNGMRGRVIGGETVAVVTHL